MNYKNKIVKTIEEVIERKFDENICFAQSGIDSLIPISN